MITDRNSLGEAMVQLTRTVANAIDLFEANTSEGSNVELKWIIAGKSAIIETEQMWRVSLEAKLDAGAIQEQLIVHGDD